MIAEPRGAHVTWAEDPSIGTEKIQAEREELALAEVSMGPPASRRARVRPTTSMSSLGSYLSTSSSVQISRYFPAFHGHTSGLIYLHWLLLHYDPVRSKRRICFDVARKVSHIQDCTQIPSAPLDSSFLDKPAGKSTLTSMTIQCRRLLHWNIVVHNSSGITCGDVFYAVYDTLNTPLTDSECEQHITERNQSAVQEAFEKRHSELQDSELRTLDSSIMRVDLLQGRRIFKGLCRRTDRDDFWLLDLEYPQTQVGLHR